MEVLVRLATVLVAISSPVTWRDILGEETSLQLQNFQLLHIMELGLVPVRWSLLTYVLFELTAIANSSRLSNFFAV